MRALAVEAKRRDTTRQATELCGGKPRHADVRLAWAGVRGPHQPVETDAAAQNRPLLQLGGAALPVIGLATWTVGGDDAGGPPDGQQRVLGSEHQRRRHVVCAPAKLNRHPRLSICGVAAQSARAVQRRVQRAQGLREGAFCRVVAGRTPSGSVIAGTGNALRVRILRTRAASSSNSSPHRAESSSASCSSTARASLQRTSVCARANASRRQAQSQAGSMPAGRDEPIFGSSSTVLSGDIVRVPRDARGPPDGAWRSVNGR
eukprot:scaffold11574_cov124-Isochrysis_galbana.AAC.4